MLISNLLRFQQDSELANMGSTVAAVILDGYQLFLANVGDTRVYLLDEENIQQLSWDHSFVGDLVRKNLITPKKL
jgi:protein phosphatase